MKTLDRPAPPIAQARPARRSRLLKASLARLRAGAVSNIAMLLALLWSIPTFGLLTTSFRTPEAINSSGWWTAAKDPQFTLENYDEVLNGGTVRFGDFLINSVVITLPAVVIPIGLALLAAYALAWIPFRGRNFLLVFIFALQIVPLQVTLVPLLSLYVDLGISGTFWPVWISHTMFGLPLAIFLLHNFMRDIPASLIEAARVDGAGHIRIFLGVILPLMTPAIAAFGVFQFLGVWNDLLVALTFGSSTDVAPLTVRLAELSGTRGSAWYLLSAGAFVAMVVPMVVFIALQRFFVRGLLAGGLKG